MIHLLLLCVAFSALLAGLNLAGEINSWWLAASPLLTGWAFSLLWIAVVWMRGR
jgi:hypothetical protein